MIMKNGFFAASAEWLVVLFALNLPKHHLFFR
jgi:hypothetical protein